MNWDINDCVQEFVSNKRFINQALDAHDFQNKSKGKKLWGINRKADDTAQCYLSIKLIELIYLIITDSSWTYI